MTRSETDPESATFESFQSFEASTRPEQGGPRIAALRAEMDREALDGFLVPRADAHQGEWVAPRDERLAWLTGFTGSAGLCIVTAGQAALFVDGRYRVQARAQTDPAHITVIDAPPADPAAWASEALDEGARVGFDPWLHTAEQIARFRARLEARNIALVATDNLIDRIWADQPDPPRGPVSVYPAAFAGEDAAARRARIGADVARAGARAAVLTLPDSIAWLLNIRGADIPRTPIAHAFAILHADGTAALFIDPAKLDDAVRAHLGEAVAIHPPEDFPHALATLAGPVLVDPATAPVAVFDCLGAADIRIHEGRDPCILPKACKNAVEIEGSRQAHIRDGVAVVEFLAWLDSQGSRADLTEIDLVLALERARRRLPELKDISFETICGSGPNGALPHYRVTRESNRRLAPGDVVVIDSGGQYLDGTTDITRTVLFGHAAPPPGAVRAFTLVLKGMIALSALRWPDGLAGRDLDPFARAALWGAGLDFDHGTGHGVGHYLSVHEGPARISRISHERLRPGMVLSNEPGYYREGAFGIRTENLVVVREAAAIAGADAGRAWLDFETLTFVPIDRRLIDASLLTGPERDWLNAYHADVAEKLAPRLGEAARAWLAEATAPI